MSALHEQMHREALERAAFAPGRKVKVYGHPGEILEVIVRSISGEPEPWYRVRWTEDGVVHEGEKVAWSFAGGVKRKRPAKKAEAKPEAPKPRKARDPRGIKPARASSPRSSGPKGPKCRSCGAPVEWCVTENGKRMPVDAEPVEDGNLVVEMQLGPSLARAYDPARDAGKARFRSHFSTCPNANAHRKPAQGGFL